MTHPDTPFEYIDLYEHDGVIVGACHCGAFVDFTDWNGEDIVFCPQCGQEWSDIDISDAEKIEEMAGSEVGDGGGVDRRIDLIVVHCSATPPSLDIGVQEITKWHQERGFRTVGYHRVIRRNGTIELGRPDILPGAHAQGHNEYSLAVCLVGGVDKDMEPEANYTPEQWESLRMVVFGWAKQYPKANIIGHRDIPGVRKACPSFDVATWLSVASGQQDVHPN